MRSERAVQALLTIQAHGEEALSFLVGVGREQFREDRRTFHAVTRCLEIISEASRRLPDAMKARHPALPWREISDAGNVYRHEYDNVATDFVFRTSTRDLLPLLEAIAFEIQNL